MIIPITTHMESCIRDFMKIFEQKTYSISSVPCEVCLLRANLIIEEHDEYMRAPVGSTDELDAIVDLLYVVIGTNIALSIQVLPYNSGQLKLSTKHKQPIFAQIHEEIQDLQCRFPCEKIQFRCLNALISRLVDVAALLGYNLKGAFDAVHNANLNKLWNHWPEPSEVEKPDGVIVKFYQDKYLVKRRDGKVIKPKNFKTADLTPYL